MSGVREAPPEFGWELVQFMKENGATVRDEFVAARNHNELVEIFLRDFNFNLDTESDPWFFVRKTDISLVDEATHLVVVVDGASHGVGMEIQRAIDKPAMGMNATPILCLIREDLYGENKPTWMIKGITQEEASGFELKTYKDLEDAKRIVQDFLINH